MDCRTTSAQTFRKRFKDMMQNSKNMMFFLTKEQSVLKT